MTYRKLLPMALLFIAFIAYGCEDDPVSSDTPSMSASIGGLSWSAADINGLIVGSLKTITGTSSDGSTIVLTLSNVNATGTYDIGTASLGASYTVGSDQFVATSGSVNVSALDGSNISGTFSFDGANLSSSNTVSITNGSFTSTLR